MWRATTESFWGDVAPKRICIIKPSAFGDVVQTLPVLAALRQRYPEATISWVIDSRIRDLLENHPMIDRLVAFDRRGSWSEWWTLLKTLRRARFDLTLDFQGLARSALMTAATNAPIRVGLETAREGSRLACHFRLPDTGRHVPAHDRYWRLSEQLGLGELRRSCQIGIDANHNAWTTRALAPLPRPRIAFHVGAGWVTKRWPVERFAVVACKAVRGLGAGIVCVGSDGELAMANQFCNLIRRFVPQAKVSNLAGKTSPRQLASVLGQVDLAVSNDSGPMHLAAAMQTPVVGIFTCTSPAISGPPGPHEFVTTRLSCAASYCKTCPRRGTNHLSCLDEISTERVLAALSASVRRHEIPHAA